MKNEVLKEIITSYPDFFIIGIDGGDYILEFSNQTLDITEEDLKYIAQISPIYQINTNEFVGEASYKIKLKEEMEKLLYYEEICGDTKACIARLSNLERVKL